MESIDYISTDYAEWHMEITHFFLKKCNSLIYKQLHMALILDIPSNNPHLPFLSRVCILLGCRCQDRSGGVE